MENRERLLNNALRTVLGSKISKNQKRIQDNIANVCDKFNDYMQFINRKWNEFDVDVKRSLQAKFDKYREKLIQCADVAKFAISLPLVIGDIIVYETDQNQSNYFSFREESPEVTQSSKNNVFSPIDPKIEDKMDGLQLIKFASSLVRTYNGDVNELDSFIINVNIVKSMTPDSLRPLLVEFIKGRLNGKALNYVKGLETLDSILLALKENIKKDSSDVIEARLEAIRFDNRNLTQFTEDVDKIADQLSQAFISEGIPFGKANEMTISRVVATCRKSARNDLVKSVLASSKFSTPKEVLSKFVVEIADQTKEKQFLAYRENGYRGRRGNLGYSTNRGRYDSRRLYKDEEGYDEQGINNNNFRFRRGNNNTNYRGRGNVRVVQGNADATRRSSESEESPEDNQ